jgi:U3 small nucleolar RNA-associated protein 10
VPGLFNVELHTAKQLRHFKFTIGTYLSSLLSSSSFLNQVAALSDEVTHELEPVYKDLIENLLLYIQTVHQIHEQQPVKYWSVMLGLAYDILDKVLIFLFDSVKVCDSGLFIILNIVHGLRYISYTQCLWS